MPRIKRWFPVSHDINHSGTMRDLMREFGLSGLRVWLEILSIADRSGEYIDCQSKGALSRLASAAETKYKRTSTIVLWLYNRGCIALEPQQNPLTRVVNYWEYHRTEERKQFPPDPTRPSGPLKSPAKNAGAVDNSELKRARKEKEDRSKLVKLAVEIGNNNPANANKLCQWTISMIGDLSDEPHNRVMAVTRNCLENVRAKIKSGYEIESVWGLLTAIFKQERTKYMQGSENQAYKNAPLERFGDILQRIAAANGSMEGGP